MSRKKRKSDHLHYALKKGQKGLSGFEDITFVHNSLPESSLSEIKLNSRIGELSLSSPIFINAMTGGGGKKTYEVNKQLGFVASQTGLAIAVGSQMSAIKDQSERKTFEVVREQNPNGIVIGNLGMEATVDHAKMAIDMIGADALQIHLNVIQELTMPEGDRCFKGVFERINDIVTSVNVPVIVKEVGFGLSMEAVRLLSALNICAVDIGGYGGTNFAEIENERRARMLTFFNEWGIQTTSSIVEAKTITNSLTIIASGGIQTSLDIAKAISLGADAVGIAGFFLKLLVEKGTEGLIKEIQLLNEELKFMMTALGVKNIAELQNIPLVITGETHHWLTERGIDTTLYSRRKIKNG
ncbi:type 2 isopentenyl-diphosphate Delta-isomerase [Bacillus aquiflavi]|uniref:Isopentenyl-diphosphate delta-isomerase n=1 Tax=Bacillus aquiflavi TaxID=2672567 RepID=A0A6B3VR40_9BACI|nr:type 2 isopentenyl-diphosphate Delta-isomerase [Bacillus aquiflavi]MBA4536065.1 type 2 isopentenyl-diphosphate Delta-isomerase [Bacillus aquiflavi]NEY80439.1 type 2 isopentenyl-diphosphate Delta-isomerase [Bacillus aquiflavi]UAC47087.1 type 2 isopentenyl-diphosphate Delta-isomerase [Bacillus aquiflavi]